MYVSASLNVKVQNGLPFRDSIQEHKQKRVPTFREGFYCKYTFLMN